MSEYGSGDEVPGLRAAAGQAYWDSHWRTAGVSLHDLGRLAVAPAGLCNGSRLKNQRGRSVSLKASEKGGVSGYGLGRSPSGS